MDFSEIEKKIENDKQTFGIRLIMFLLTQAILKAQEIEQEELKVELLKAKQSVINLFKIIDCSLSSRV